jgi:hypothetical protein
MIVQPAEIRQSPRWVRTTGRGSVRTPLNILVDYGTGTYNEIAVARAREAAIFSADRLKSSAVRRRR